jgi:hypothetical protein
MNLVTNLRHYVSTWPRREKQNYQVWEIHKKNWYEYEIIKIEWEHMLIKWKVWQFCVWINYNFDKILWKNKKLNLKN